MKYFLLLSFLLGVYCGISQDISAHVPTLSSSVFVINNKSIHEKCSRADLKTYSFFKEFKENSNQYISGAKVEETLVPMLVANAEEFGISTTDRSYVFVRDKDSIKYTAFISRIANEDALNNLVKSMLMSEDEISNGVGEGFEFAFNDNMGIAWNSTMVVFMDYRIPYYAFASYGFESAMEEIEPIETPEDDEYYESYADKLEAEEQKRIERKRNTVMGAFEEIYNPNPDHTMVLNPRFQNATQNNSEVTVFIDGANSFKELDGIFGAAEPMGETLSMMSDNYLFIDFNINDKDLTAEMTYHISDRFKDQMNATNKAKFNKKALKYIDGQNLIGFFGFAIDPEPYYDMMMDMYSTIMSSVPEYGEIAAGALDIFNILLDEDEVFDFIKGDAVFAVTDIKEFDVTYTTYEYDEDFNELEVTTTKKEPMPEYTFVASIGNEPLRSRILRMMEKSDLLVFNEGYYTYQPPFSRYRRSNPSGLGGTHYVAVENDVLIITNNKDLVTLYRQSGLPKTNWLNKEHRTILKKNNYVGYWDANRTFTKLSEEMKSLGKDFFKMMEVADSTFKNATVCGLENDGNLFKTTLSLNFVNENKIAIVQLLEFVESIGGK